MRFLFFVLGFLLCTPSVAQPTADFGELTFRMVGPTRGGRVTAVAGHADRPHTFYMGATGGGVWQTNDDGASWDNISDGFFNTGSIGSIDVADSDPDVIWVGTGSEAIRSNVILGRGIYRSTDAGATWKHMGLDRTGQIGAVVVHPTNPEVVYVAALGNPFAPNADRGIYKTVDAGETWQHVLFVSDRTGGVDLELNPSNPDEVYAAMWRAERKPWTIISGDANEDGFYKSTDGGATWRKINAGLPQGLIGKLDLAVTPDDPSRIYALVEARPEEEGLYRSNDRGETWRLVNSDGALMTRPFYYTNVDADPSDADVVYVNNLGFHRSADGGATFRRLSTPHGDNHDMWISPTNPDVMIQSNDGGANVTRDGGRTWSTQENQPTAELYQVNVDDRVPYWLYAGQQDNSTIAVPSLPTGTHVGGVSASWEAVGGCETGPVVPMPGNPDVVYANCKGRFGRFDRTTGQEQQFYVGAANMYGRNPAELTYRFQRVVPIEVSPHDPATVYHGSQYVHRTTDGGQTWEQISPDLTAFRPERQMVSGGPITRDITGEEHYSTLYVIEESPVEPGVIWTGSNDGPVHVSRDGGANWKDVTPADMPAEGRIQHIDPSPHQAGKAYVAGYRTLLGDFSPYAYRTSDYGAHWTRITDGIPGDTPVRVVREDPNRQGLLYAGTEYGLYVSFNDGASWSPFQQNLPVTPITDLKVHRQDLVLSTMGRSFWILDDLTPLYATGQPSLFPPRDAMRLRHWGRQGGDSAPSYPSPGATLHYWLTSSVDSLVLEILDPAGGVIRTVRPDAPSSDATEGQGMRGPAARSARASGLSAEAGLHRFVWDLRHEGAIGESGRPGRGPLAVPDAYTVRLRVDGSVYEQPLRLVIDPRVEAAGISAADMREQLAFNLDVRDAITETWALVRLADSLKSASGLSSKDAQTLSEVLGAIRTDDRDSYPPPMLGDQLGYLASMTGRADQRPGADAYARLVELRAELAGYQNRVERIRSSVRGD